jgi:NhaP-type Na+/H+ and K+/H+ antiporter
MLITSFVETYLARSYLQSKCKRPEMDDSYWARAAVTDAGIVLFFGPLLSWLIVAVFARVQLPRGVLVYPLMVVGMGFFAHLLAAAIARSGRWRDRLQGESVNPDRKRRHLVTKISSWVLWCGVVPIVVYLVMR